MKKLLLFVLLFLPLLTWAQAPQLFNYQGIARQQNGLALANTKLQLRISILDGVQNGTIVYTENHTVNTNQFGLYQLQVGNGVASFGLFEAIQWNLHNKYIKVEVQENNKYQDLGTTQLLSVPYALYAAQSGTTINDKTARAGTANYLSKFDATGASNAEINSQVFDNGSSVGIATTTPAAKVHIRQTTAASNVLLMEHTDSTGFGRFAFYNDAGFANRATFTRYGSKNTSTIAPLFPAANLLAFGCNKGSFLISTAGDAGISVINGGTSRLKFFAEDSTLNVGIGGSTFPQSRVHINNTDGTNTDVRITNNTTGHAATDGLVISENANVASITNTENANLTLGTNNTARINIGAAGNVVVNAPTSGPALEVNGTVKINGGTPGAGKVLTSDALGNATWQTAGNNNYTGGSGITITGSIIAADDPSPTNELQNLSLSGNNLTLSNGGGSVTLPTGTTYTQGSGILINGGVISNIGDLSTTNELQNLSLSGNNLTLSNGGGSVTLPTGTTYTQGSGININANTISATDTSNTNELQNLSLSGNNLTLSNGGGSVTLPTGTTYTQGSGININANTISATDTSNTNELQNLSLSGNNLTLSNGGGSVTLPTGTTYTQGSGILINGGVISNIGDLSTTNEIQNLSLSGNNLTLSNGGGSVTLPTGTTYTAGTGITINTNTINAVDNSATNEIQSLSITGNTLSLSNGGGSVTLPSSSSTNYWNAVGTDILNTNTGAVGIGAASTPLIGGLVVDKKVGAVNALFGSNTSGISIESNHPYVGLNTYYNAGRKHIGAGYGGIMGLNPTTGDINIYTSDSGAANSATADALRMRINKNGNIGIEGNSNPQSALSFANTIGNKINLFHVNSTSNYGIGISSATLQQYVPSTSQVFAWGYGNSANFTEKMRLTGNGNLGIDAVPAYKLDVNGRMRLRHNGNTSGVWFNNSNNAESSFAGQFNDSTFGLFTQPYWGNWLFKFDMKNSNMGIGFTTPQYPLSFEDYTGDKISLYGGNATKTSNHYGLGIQGFQMQLFVPGTSEHIAFGYGRSAAFTELARIEGSGQFLLGTNSSLYTTHLKRNSNQTLLLDNSASHTIGAENKLTFKTGSYFDGMIKTTVTGGGSARLGFFTYAGILETSLVERMSIIDNGDVLIGTTNETAGAGYKLRVNGKIIATELRVQVNSLWPDYVFADDYKLLPIKDLATYINKEKHLPNIPSAQQVQEQGGIDAGDMNKRLMEKVEELTLYIIDLQKQIDQLKKD
jgi:hypothetical protein